MKLHPSLCRGLTLPEVLVVLAALVLVAGLVLPYFSGKRQPPAKRISCMSNLKQIGLAMRMWSNDHGEQFPWRVPRHEPARCPGNHGANVCEGTGDPLQAINDGNVTIFQSISNELNSPKVLMCPTDTGRRRAETFDPTRINAYLRPDQSSYFVGLLADETKPQSLLVGDRNVAGGMWSAKRRTWSARAAGEVDARFDRSLHHHEGNVGMADGSATHVGVKELPKLIATANVAMETNTVLQFPE